MRQIVSDYLENQDASLLDDMTSEEQRFVANQAPKAKKAAEQAAAERAQRHDLILVAAQHADLVAALEVPQDDLRMARPTR